MSIDPSSATPVFQQIVDYLQRLIASGVYRPGELIPSVRALALELRVNPNTVQRAYQALERDAVVTARKGVGMVVTGFIPNPLGHITDYSPTGVEVAVTVGVYALGFLVLTMIDKIVVNVRERMIVT